MIHRLLFRIGKKTYKMSYIICLLFFFGLYYTGGV